MNIFDLLVVQPIFNALLTIYAILPGNDFGLSLIIFTILLRLALWPLVKKQLQQTKLMRQVQPQLKTIKKKAKGNKTLEAQLMMELYKEKGVKPFSSIGLLLIQLPIFIALFWVIQIISTERERIADFVYGFIQVLDPIKRIVDSPDTFNESLFGIVDLTRQGVSSEGIYLPVVAIALIAAIFQFIQSKQTLPTTSDSKKLRDVLKDSAAGKQVDQSEVTAIMTSKVVLLLPIVLFFVALYFPGALVLYYAVFSIVAVIQQHFALKSDVDEMQQIASEPSVKVKAKNTKERLSTAEEAVIVGAPNKRKGKKGSKRKRR